MVPLPVPAAIAGTVANAISKTIPIQRFAICASFDPARNETCASARFSPQRRGGCYFSLALPLTPSALPALQIIGDAQHLVCGLYAFRIGFVRALRRENPHHRFDDRDVRSLEHAESQLRPVLASRDDVARRSRLGRRIEERAAGRAQPVRRRELRDPNVTDRPRPVSESCGNRPVVTDGEAARVVRNVKAVEAAVLLRRASNRRRPAKTRRRACTHDDRVRRSP